MLGGLSRGAPTGSGPVIGVLAMVFIGAIAFAVPPSRIAVSQDGPRRGFLLGVSRFSTQLAEQLGRRDYNYIAIDLTKAGLERDAIWRSHFKRVAERQFPMWGWVEVRNDAQLKHAAEVVKNLQLGGLFVYGPDAAATADALSNSVVKVIPVIRLADERPEGDYAVAMTLAEFQANGKQVKLPILIANQLGAAEIDAARAAVEGDYLIAGVAILD